MLIILLSFGSMEYCSALALSILYYVCASIMYVCISAWVLVTYGTSHSKLHDVRWSDRKLSDDRTGVDR